jgi:hypothetical protein
MRDPLELIAAYFDDGLTPGELAELRDWLQDNPRRLRLFVRESVVHSRLRDVLVQQDMRGFARDEFFGDTIDPRRIASLLDEEEAAAARRAQEEEERARRQALAAANLHEQLDRKLMRIEEPRSHNAFVYATLAAAAVLLVMLGRFTGQRPEAKPLPQVAKEQPAPAEPPLIAEITKTLDASIFAENRPIELGGKLRPGSLFVERGAVEVSFAAGAKVVIEGPARLELVSAERARLLSGRVVAHVPPQALGFTLRSDMASFVDLGTEFGLEVDGAGVTSIHVIDGEVALVSDKKNEIPSRTLQRGRANAVAVDGAVRDIPFDEGRFIRRVPASKYELAVLKSRPLAYWHLEQAAVNAPWSSEGRLELSTVANAGVAAADNIESGRAGGPPRAASFTGDHDGIDITANAALGLVSKCTWEAWVLPTEGPTGPRRIYSTFDRPRSGLAIGLVNGRWYDFPNDDLKLQLTVYGVYDTMGAQPVALHQWVHVAATVEADGKPTLYVNGASTPVQIRNIVGAEPDKPIPWAATGPTPVGRTTSGVARIGRNPLGSDGHISPERWQGQISHVAVYDRVLSPQESRQHFEATRAAEATAKAPAQKQNAL